MLTNEQISQLKSLGCLRDKTTSNCFNVRVITGNGKLNIEKMNVISEAAKQFGNGEIALTTRQTIEIQKVPYQNIELLINYLNEKGIETGGTGPKVRPIVSCKGTTCIFGLIDTFKLSEKIHQLYYQGYHHIKLPHKFKIAVGGCPNNCVKPDLNDLGIIGQCIIDVCYDKCHGCKVCNVLNSCPMKAVSLQNNKIQINTTLCNNCGRCLNKCPFNVTNNYQQGYKLYIGGRWGKKYNRGIELSKIFTSEDEILNTIEKVILLYKDLGINGERLSEVIQRLGFSNFENMIYSNNILERKNEILNK